MNLAARVEDGQQIDVPYQSGAGPSSSSSLPPSNSNPFPFTVISSTPTANPAAADLVNINTATLQELDALPGIGPTTAQNIITYRQQHGPFQHIEDIMNVPGIGPATFDRLSSLITVGP